MRLQGRPLPTGALASPLVMLEGLRQTIKHFRRGFRKRACAPGLVDLRDVLAQMLRKVSQFRLDLRRVMTRA